MTKKWDSVKPFIRDLYIERKKSLSHVRNIMSRDHGFNASTRSYKNKFKEWGWLKKGGTNLGTRRPNSVGSASPVATHINTNSATSIITSSTTPAPAPEFNFDPPMPYMQNSDQERDENPGYHYSLDVKLPSQRASANIYRFLQEEEPVLPFPVPTLGKQMFPNAGPQIPPIRDPTSTAPMTFSALGEEEKRDGSGKLMSLASLCSSIDQDQNLNTPPASPPDVYANSSGGSTPLINTPSPDPQRPLALNVSQRVFVSQSVYRRVLWQVGGAAAPPAPEPSSRPEQPQISHLEHRESSPPNIHNNNSISSGSGSSSSNAGSSGGGEAASYYLSACLPAALSGTSTPSSPDESSVSGGADQETRIQPKFELWEKNPVLKYSIEKDGERVSSAVFHSRQATGVFATKMASSLSVQR